MFLVGFLAAQDTIRFNSGEVKAVKVQDVGLKEIKYNRFDNLSGPVYVCSKDEVSSIRYSNGSVDTFTSNSQKTEIPKAETPKTDSGNPSQTETPAYVNNSSASAPQSEKINISGKRLYYQHEPLNEKALLSLIKDHPDHRPGNKTNHAEGIQ
jgi:hypothetical protein